MEKRKKNLLMINKEIILLFRIQTILHEILINKEGFQHQ